MQRSLRILRAQLRNSIAIDLEYRWDVVFNGVTMLLSLAAGAMLLAVMFKHAGAVGGWSFHQALGLYGVFLFFEELAFRVMTANIGALPEDIRTGSMDFVLLRPISSQWYVSTRRFPFTCVPNLLLALGIVVYAMARLGTLTPLNLALFVVLMGSGVLIMYGVWALLLTTAFWLVRVENITELFHAAFSTGRFPVTAFPGWLKLILTVVLPVAFITTVPAGAAVGQLDWSLALLSPVIALAVVSLSHLFWRQALRHYTSASS